ncbi:MAG: acetolactate decarboxylase [Candidatus Methanofastidiosum sp.]|nr:acetolactate decarboxylase [Methanofastidiosum sp.]
MTKKNLILTLTLISLILSLGCIGQGSNLKIEKDIIYQYSTIEALLEGIYDGNMTFGELKAHGDYGLGTVNALDGEMIQVDGKFYQIKIDGIAYPIEDNEKTPFAIVSFFDLDKSVEINGPLNYEQFTEYLDENLPTNNLYYMVVVRGHFDYIKTRSVPRQQSPYVPLVKAIEGQKTFEFTNVKGTLIGFRMPEYVGDMNVPGYHFHFITEDKKAGGHVLELMIQDQEAYIDYTDNFFMKVPENKLFYNLNSGQGNEEDVQKVEKGK